MTKVLPKAKTKKVKKAAQPEKRIKRTAGVKVTGACGHEYASRVSLWPIAGEPATESMLQQREAMIKDLSAGLQTSDCPECVASKNFTEAAKDEQEILEGLGLPSLPELRGTLRQKAWARQERLSMISGIVSEQMWSSATPHLTDAILDAALASSFGPQPQEFGEPFQELFLRLRMLINSGSLSLFWGLRDPKPTDRELLMTWLSVRKSIEELHILGEAEARTWILMSKNRRMRLRYGPYRPNVNRELAVRMIVGTPGWQDPEQMYAAVNQLLLWADDDDRGLLKVNAGMVLPEILEQISVMRALKPREDFPF